MVRISYFFDSDASLNPLSLPPLVAIGRTLSVLSLFYYAEEDGSIIDLPPYIDIRVDGGDDPWCHGG